MPRLLLLGRDVALAALAFAVGAALVRGLVPDASGDGLDLKLAYLEAHRDEFDALYIGSSCTQNGLDPAIVDEELARAGTEQRSFNLAVAGLFPFEQDYVLRRVLSLGSRRLKRIFIEAGPVGMTLPGHHPFDDSYLATARGAQWHTLRGTRLVLAALPRLPISLGRRLELARAHLECFARNATALGRGRDILSRSRDDALALAERAFVTRRRGAGFYDLEALPASLSRRQFLERPADYAARVASIAGENALHVRTEELALDLFRDQARDARAAGIELVHFTIPSFEGSPEALHLHELGILPVLLHFNDPVRFPELFAPDHRWDAVHLNGRGVERFSLLLARGYLEHARGDWQEE